MKTLPRDPRTLLGGVFLLTLGACGGDASSRPPAEGAVPNVRAVPVQEGTLNLPVEATGVLGPRDQVPLSFSVGGVVLSVGADPGDRVEPGSTLASLDLREIDAALDRATTLLEKAERDLARMERLQSDGVVPLASLQDSRTARSVARAEWEATRFNRSLAVIQAPESGVVLRRFVEAGERVQPGQPVLLLGGDGGGEVLRVGLPDRDLIRVGLGDPAEVRFPARPDTLLLGVVTRMGEAADPRTGTFPVEVTLNGPSRLPAGAVGRVVLRPPGGAAVWRIPPEALLEADGSVGTLFVIPPGEETAELRVVHIAGLDGDAVALLWGVGAGDRIITQGGALLRDGSAVRVLP